MGPMARHVYSRAVRGWRNSRNDCTDFNQILLNDKDQVLHRGLRTWGEFSYLRLPCCYSLVICILNHTYEPYRGVTLATSHHWLPTVIGV